MKKLKNIAYILILTLILGILPPSFTLKVEAAEKNARYEGAGSYTYTVPETGYYHITLAGGNGGQKGKQVYARGGLTDGDVVLKKGQILYITLGGNGTFNPNGSAPGGFNGGGSTMYAGSGGGASVVALTNESLTTIKDENLILVSGGGGGESRNSTSTIGVGNGGGLYGGYSSTTPGGTQLSGYKKGLGESGTTSIGAGGGGYWGGYAAKNAGNGGGSGGSGYYNPSYLENYSVRAVSEIGSRAYFDIKYTGRATSKVEIYIGPNGSVNGTDARYCLNFEGDLGTSVTFAKPVPTQSYIKFERFENAGGDGKLVDNNDGTFTYTFGYHSTWYEAIYSGAKATLTATQSGNKLIASLNGSAVGKAELFTLQGSSDNINWKNLAYFTSGSYTNVLAKRPERANGASSKNYTVMIPGTYKITLLGGGAGNDGGHNGGSGGTFVFQAHLTNQNVTLYGASHGHDSEEDGSGDHEVPGGGGIASGGRGMYSGGGGGAAGVKFNGALIAVAGGGGGANWATGHGARNRYDGSGEIGGMNGENGTWHGENGDDTGGGGAGWNGGRRGTGSDGGYGGRNNISTNGYSISILQDSAGGYGGGKHDGYAQIEPVSFDYPAVPADGKATVSVDIPDVKAPDAPEKSFLSKYTSKYITFTLEKTKDYGGEYFVKVNNYTDVKKFSYISGFKGWKYVVDSNKNTVVTNANSFTGSSVLNIEYEVGRGRYLHVAAIDNAGNISSTYTIEIPNYVTITCIDKDIVTGKELGRSTTPSYLDIDGFDVVDNMFLYGTKVSGTCWGTSPLIDKYYKDYYYKAGSATTITVPKDPGVVYRYFVPALVYTTQINPSNTPNVYADPMNDKTYFVQAGSDFSLETNGRTLYQEDVFRTNNVYYYFYHKGIKQVTKAYVGNMDNGNNASVTSDNIIAQKQSYKITRTNNNLYLNYIQHYIFPESYDNKMVEVIPNAEVIYKEGGQTRIVTSTANKTDRDVDHNIFINTDAAAPVISFPDSIKPDENGNVPILEEKTTFVVKYADFVKDVNPLNPQYGSGVNTKNIKVTLIQEQTDDGGAPYIKFYNKDTVNNILKIKEKDLYTGELTFVINPQEYEEMSGFITLKIEITDNVGNKAENEVRFLVMDLQAHLSNIVEKSKDFGTNKFTNGEHGKITVETNGFVDKVDFAFPSNLDNLAQNEKSNAGSNVEAYWLVGRTLSDTYPRDKDGNITTVLPQLQTKLWGTEHIGGMQWNGSNYEHCSLVHYFYMPLYSPQSTYHVTVTASKVDPKNPDKIYKIFKILDFSSTNTELGHPKIITAEIRDTIIDN